MLGHNPALSFLCVSYGQDLSDDYARDCLKIMQCRWYREALAPACSPSSLRWLLSKSPGPPGMPPMDDAARDAYFGFAARGIFNGNQADRAAYCQMLDGLHAAMPDPFDSSIAFPAIPASWISPNASAWSRDGSALVGPIRCRQTPAAFERARIDAFLTVCPVDRTQRSAAFIGPQANVNLAPALTLTEWLVQGAGEVLPSKSAVEGGRG